MTAHGVQANEFARGTSEKHRAVLVHGQSGTGKTMVVQVGVHFLFCYHQHIKSLPCTAMQQLPKPPFAHIGVPWSQIYVLA